jgi:Ribbon-helix-helix protein, copG family
MVENGDIAVEFTLDSEVMKRLVVCAAWRNVSVAQLVRAYVEDWIAIDYPESQGRLTRRGIYRDEPIGLASGPLGGAKQ